MVVASRIGRVHAEIDEKFPEHLTEAREFLRLRSVTGHSTELVRTAEWLQKRIEDCSGEVELVRGEVAPLVLATFSSEAQKRLLVYGMYDVQPANPQGWRAHPFEAEIENLPHVGPSIIARGACNSKGPLIGFLNAIRAINRVDKLPVNLLLTIEGEEEIGSPTLRTFYAENRDRLRVDAGYEPFWGDYGLDVDRPVLGLGTKGLLSFQLVCRGGAWGGPLERPVHSSVGAWLASPAWRLVKAVNTLMNENEDVTIDDFYSEVAPPTAEDEALMRDLHKVVDENVLLTKINAQRFKYSLKGVDLLRRFYFSPSMQVSFLQDVEGDAIPHIARAQVVIRLVPEMRSERIVARIRKHLDTRGYGDIEIAHLESYPWSRTSKNSTIFRSMVEAYRYHGYDPLIIPMMASATPYYLFSDVLRIPYVWGGAGRAGGSHSVDEYVSIEGFKEFEKSIATFLYKFASA